MKLSKPQTETLFSICNCTEALPFTCINTYKPALKLIELGLVTKTPLTFARLELRPTQLGRDLAAKLQTE